MSKTTIIYRRNPKTGAIEYPFRDGRNNFVLGDPAHGAELHHKTNAILTEDYKEALRLVRRGFSIRMSASDGSPPSLISAGALQLEDVDDVPEGAIPPKALLAPFPIDDVLRDLQRALIAEAAMISHWGSDEAAESFLGAASPSDAGEPYEYTLPEEVDLSRFRATALVRTAYDWAFQMGNPGSFRPEQWDNLASLVDGASPGTIATPSPMANPESALRVTIGTASARWKLEFEHWLPLSVREIAYLGQMSEVAARNSLAKMGIRARGGVENDVARQWLAGRRKYVETGPELLPLNSAVEPGS